MTKRNKPTEILDPRDRRIKIRARAEPDLGAPKHRMRFVDPGDARTKILHARVEPELAAAVQQVRAANQVESTSETIRALIYQGLHIQVAEARAERPLDKPMLRRSQVAERSMAHVEAILNLFVEVTRYDAEGALATAKVAHDQLGRWIAEVEVS